MLYFIQAKKTRLIKIGFSTNPKDRCRILKSFNADSLRILKIIKGNRTGENDLHKRFRKYRHHNEWYYPNQEILDFIEETDSYILKEDLECEIEEDYRNHKKQHLKCPSCQIPLQLKSKERFKDWYECPKCEYNACVYHSFKDFVDH